MTIRVQPVNPTYTYGYLFKNCTMRVTQCGVLELLSPEQDIIAAFKEWSYAHVVEDDTKEEGAV